MYRNLNAEMARNGLSFDDLAKLLNITHRTAKNKLSGLQDFKLGEAKKIKQAWFKKMSLDYLFKAE